MKEKKERISYLIGGYYSGIIANIFSVCRNIYIEKSTKRSPWIIVMIVLIGGIISMSVNRVVVSSSIWDYIPTISIVVYSLGQVFIGYKMVKLQTITMF